MAAVCVCVPWTAGVGEAVPLPVIHHMKGAWRMFNFAAGLFLRLTSGSGLARGLPALTCTGPPTRLQGFGVETENVLSEAYTNHVLPET